MPVGSSRILRLFRSPKLAAWLIAGIGVYIALVTLVPRGPVSEPKVAAWAASHPVAERYVASLGLHRPYTTPVFLLLIVLLEISTVVCAWDRTVSSLRDSRGVGVVTPESLARLRDRGERIPLPAGMSRGEAFDTVERVLRGSRMRVRRGPVLLEADSWRLAIFGSPALHWALAAILALVMAGQLARSEGRIGVRVGDAVPESHASYGVVEEGPLFLERHTGDVIAVRGLDLDHRAGGHSRGPAPYVSIVRGGRDTGARWVYPNNPLRSGRLLVHYDLYGIAPAVTVFAPDGSIVTTGSFPADFAAAREDGTIPIGVTLAQGETDQISLRIAVRLDPGERPGSFAEVIPSDQAVELSYRVGSSTTFTAPVRLGVGGDVALPSGMRVRYDGTGYYVRLVVVQDRSVFLLYLAFGIACAATVITVFVPPRTVWVLVEDPLEPRLVVRVSARRSDPVFRELVVRRLAEAVGSGHEEEVPS